MAEQKQNTGNLRSANSRFHDLTLRFVKILNAIVMTIPFAFAWYVYYADNIRAPYYRRGNWVIK